MINDAFPLLWRMRKYAEPDQDERRGERPWKELDSHFKKI